MRTLLFCLVALSVLSGCTMYESAEYDRAWIATQQVLEDRGLQTMPSGYEENTLIAVSKMHSDFLSKTRVKVVVRIVENEEGIYEPSVKVVNQIDLSDSSTLMPARRQPNKRWANVSSNPDMEVDIENDILAILHGRNSYSGKLWTPVGRSHSVPQHSQATSDQNVEETQATTEFTPETW